MKDMQQVKRDPMKPVKRKKLPIVNGYALFWGNWPSNWEPSPFILDGQKYNCVEQWMMAEKARLFGDKVTRAKILRARYPKAQKELGRQVNGFNDELWVPSRYQIVLKGTLAKYRQNQHLKELLLATGDAPFVECSPYDGIWGIALGAKDPDATNPLKWKGANLLGRAIDEARRLIRLES